MHHWNNAHEGHTEHCCLCIPTNVGAHILGFFATLSTIMSIVSAIGLLTGSTDAAGNPVSPAASVSPLISSLLTGYPAVMFLLMVKHNHEDSRKHYAKAYKIMVQITNVLVVITGVSAIAAKELTASEAEKKYWTKEDIIKIFFDLLIRPEVRFSLSAPAREGEALGLQHWFRWRSLWNREWLFRYLVPIAVISLIRTKEK